jgi:hypothetical protein
MKNPQKSRGKMQKVVQMNGKQLRPLYLREAKNRKDVKGKKRVG